MHQFRPADLSINSVLLNDEYEFIINSEGFSLYLRFLVRKTFYVIAVK